MGVRTLQPDVPSQAKVANPAGAVAAEAAVGVVRPGTSATLRPTSA